MFVKTILDGRVPQRMSKGAAGFDVFARSVDFIANSKVDIRLGFSIDCSNESLLPLRDDDFAICDALRINFVTLLLPRSGWGAKYGFALRNTAGVIDPDYRGEVIMAAKYDTLPPELRDFEEGKELRVGQILIVPCFVGALIQVDELGSTERGANGFGSSGV